MIRSDRSNHASIIAVCARIRSNEPTTSAKDAGGAGTQPVPRSGTAREGLEQRSQIMARQSRREWAATPAG